MNNEELPDYKVTFLREMDQLREQQMREQANEDPSILAQPTVPAVASVENNIINTGQYSGADWKAQLNQSSYANHHAGDNHALSLLVNPQIGRKSNNIQLTQIAEYSNAMHNKTVFVNPKFTSC